MIRQPTSTVRGWRRAVVASAVFPVVLAGLARAAAPAEGSWIFQPGPYSHSAETGERVVQFAALPAPTRPFDATYVQSGYRHSRTTIRGGAAADHLHRVETWGAGERIRPYGEWLRPFREGATPFGPWGRNRGPWTLPFPPWAVPYGLPQTWGGWPIPWPDPSPFRSPVDSP